MEILIFSAIITALIGLLFWFMRDKFNILTKTDIRLEDKIDKMGNKVEETRGAMIEMQDTFERIGYPMKRIIQATSPLSLTDYGKQLVEESGFNNLLQDNRDLILSWIKEKNPKTQYDAQEVSREVLLKHKDDVVFKPLKDYTYKHGETSLGQILRAGSIVVRDEIIKEFNFTE